jgi:hypothetical protein
MDSNLRRPEASFVWTTGGDYSPFLRMILSDLQVGGQIGTILRVSFDTLALAEGFKVEF